MKESILKIMNELSGNANIGSILGTMFKYMQITEDLINAKMAEYPEESDMIFHSFGLFSGDEQNLFSDLDDAVFTHHVNELLDRVGTGQIKTKEQREAATLAEIMAGIMQASLAVPFNNEYHLLYCHLFAEILGKDKMEALFPDRIKRGETLEQILKAVPWPGWIEEEIASLRRKGRKERNYPTHKLIQKWMQENPESEFPWMKYKQSEPVQLVLA